MKVVILCGGKGLRMRGLTEDVPKALAKLNGKPIIWHIMKLFSQYNHTHFILPLGYKGDQIKEYFMDYPWRDHNFELNLSDNKYRLLNETDSWKVTCVDTGLDTMTGARIKLVEKYLDEDTFLLTYGDGLADINLEELVNFHKEKGKAVTLTGIKKNSQYGVLAIENGIAVDFTEKPVLDITVNGGFFVCNRKFFDYLTSDPNCVLEDEPLKKLINDRELAVYEHNGLWLSIDTPKDLEEANKIWALNQRGQ
ncbi:sugar phosphate nucleotidyltransferase [Neobacillus drentensis]|uniref:sugar phosphate nucleotidyltransferase n=1 Tax=Neobacillus drentensis TaxID=220684 RepID=UPI003000EBF8